MIRKIYIVLTVLVLLAGCNEPDTLLENEELIFSNSFPVKVPAYEYNTVDGSTYHVAGDTNENGWPDTLSSEPVFIWQDLDIPIVTVAIFAAPIEVQGNEIVNVKDIVWQWHNGLVTEKSDTVQYSDGRTVLNGAIGYDEIPPEPLPALRNYYWAIWGWGRSGTNILFSSRPMEFYVLND